jgi:DNA-binding NarL/FixJ family response regulator
MRQPAARTGILLDPSRLWSDALESILPRIGIEVRGKATSADEALTLIGLHTPDVLIVDLPDRDGDLSERAFFEQARRRAPLIRIIALSASSEPARISRALSAGASAYVTKRAAAEDFATAVRQSFERSVFLPRDADEPDERSRAEEKAKLTLRESEILRLVAEGKPNPRIARDLWITPQTVKYHVSNIYRKLGVANRTEASRWAHQHGLLEART